MITNKELARLNLEAALKALARNDLTSAKNLAGTARDDIAKAMQAREGSVHERWDRVHRARMARKYGSPTDGGDKS